jgi:hypothetical protein
MALTIIPVAPSVVPPMRSIPSVSQALPLTAPIEGGSFLRTTLLPPWNGGDTARHPLWITPDSQYPHAIVGGSLPEEVPSPYQGMSAEWAATVSQLVYAGLAEIQNEEAVLTDFLRIRAPGFKSGTISHLGELEAFLGMCAENPRLSSGIIEPVPYEGLIGPAQELAVAIRADTATEAERRHHTRLMRALIHRVEESIDALRGRSPGPDSD